MYDAVDNHAAIQHSGVFVELPACEIVSQARVVRAPSATLHTSDTATAQVVMERMRQPDGLVFHHLPGSVKPTDVVTGIAGEESVPAALNVLLQPLTVIDDRGCSEQPHVGGARQHEDHEDHGQPPHPNSRRHSGLPGGGTQTDD